MRGHRQSDDDVDLMTGLLFGDAPAACGLDRYGAADGKTHAIVGSTATLGNVSPKLVKSGDAGIATGSPGSVRGNGGDGRPRRTKLDPIGGDRRDLS